MLASECTWIVLRAEHTRIRGLLDQIRAALNADAWKRHRITARPLELVDRLQTFDEATHRPKGVVLLDILRGRSAEADELLDGLELDRKRCDALLAQAKAALRLVESGDADAIDAVETLLSEHARLMRGHLEREDTLLHLQMDLLLTREEWATVVSGMSVAMRTAKGIDSRPRTTNLYDLDTL